MLKRKRSFLLLEIFVVLMALGMRAPPSLAAGESADIVVRVDIQGEVVRISAETGVAASSREAWDVLTDFDHLSQFISSITSSKILSRENNVVRIAQSGKTSFGPFTFEFQSERELTLTPFEKFESRMISGNMKRFHSTTQLETLEGATRIRYHSEAVPENSFLLSLGRSTIEAKTREHFEEIRKEIARRKSLAAAQ